MPVRTWNDVFMLNLASDNYLVILFELSIAYNSLPSRILRLTVRYGANRNRTVISSTSQKYGRISTAVAVTVRCAALNRTT